MDNLMNEQIEAAEEILRSKGEFLAHFLKANQIENSLRLQEVGKLTLTPNHVKELIIEMSYLIYTAYWYSIPIGNLTTEVYFHKIDVEQGILKPYLTYSVSQEDNNESMLQTVETILKKLSYFEGWLDDEMKNFISYVQSSKYMRLRQDIHRSLKYLQLSYMFRKNSMLLKIQNCSLISTILSEQEYFNKVFTKVCQEEQILYKYHAMERRGGEAEDMEVFLVQQQKIIKQLMEEDLVEQVTVESAYDTTAYDTYQLNFVMTIGERKFILSDAIMQLLQQQERPQYNIEKLCHQYDIPSNELYFVYSYERHSTSLQLFTDVANSTELSDFIAMQCHYFNVCNNLVSLQLADRASSNDKHQWLTFKVNNCHSIKEPLIEKIIYMCDILMVSRLIFQDVFQDVTKKVERQRHYSRILAEMFEQLLKLREERSKIGKKDEE